MYICMTFAECSPGIPGETAPPNHIAHRLRLSRAVAIKQSASPA